MPVRGRATRWVGVGVVLGAVALLGGCEEIEELRDEWRAETPHEAYLRGLHDAGLATTALSQAWIREAAEAVRDPRPVSLPFQEEGFMPPEDPTAVGYRFRLERGQQLTVALEVESDESTRVFLDLFRLPEDSAEAPRPLTGVDTTATGMVYEPGRGGEFLVRVQPELLRGGRYRLVLTLDPALAFPVQGARLQDVGSVFGDPRDGGSRSHHGVDIFAPRGTPVVASSTGTVRRANITNLGGKVVWLSDSRWPRSLYYAHLDSQVVARGDRVEPGDTLGFVGNSGNARTTPPHLHYGIYYRGEGPVDPLPFLRTPPGRLPDLLAEASVLGTTVRSTSGVAVRGGPSSGAALVAELPGNAPLRVLGGNAGWYRVALPDGRAGYVPSSGMGSAAEPIDRTVVDAERLTLSRPAEGAPGVERVPAGTSLPVLGAFGRYLLVQGPSGRSAWLEADAD